MSEVNIGYAIKVKQTSTGKSGYLYGNGFGDPKFSYMWLVKDPGEFLSGRALREAAYLKSQGLEIEGFVKAKAVVIERPVTKAESDRFQMLDEVRNSIHKHTIQDVLGHEQVKFIWDEFYEAGNLRKEFDQAAAVMKDGASMEYLGSVILGAQNKVTYGVDNYSRPAPQEGDLQDVVLQKRINANSAQDNKTMLVLADVFKKNGGEDVKVGGVYLKLLPDDPYNWNQRQIQGFMERQRKGLSEVQAVVAKPAP